MKLYQMQDHYKTPFLTKFPDRPNSAPPNLPGEFHIGGIGVFCGGNNMALYEAGQFVNPRRLSYMVEGHPLTLAELNANWQTNSQVYDLGYLLIEYLVEKWSRQHVVDLIKTFGDISSVLGISVSEFEAGWYEFVMKKY